MTLEPGLLMLLRNFGILWQLLHLEFDLVSEIRRRLAADRLRVVGSSAAKPWEIPGFYL